jgi:uncharacterized protein (DUF4415 family)
MAKEKGFEPGHGYDHSDWNEVFDNPEWTAADIALATPFAEASPDLQAALDEALSRRKTPEPRVPISLRIDIDVLQKLQATGPGWQIRANDALRKFVETLD